MNIAIIHDWLSEFAGADKVLWQLKQIYPQADIYTSIYDSSSVPQFNKYKVYTTYLQKIPFSKILRPMMVPLMPLAFEQLDLSKYDLVISNSTSAAKGVITKPKTCHISYCHTPTRYLWMPEMDTRASSSWLRRKANKSLKIWDTAAVARVDYFIANSKNVQDRIQKFYHRDSEVVYPPVDTSYYNLKKEEIKKKNYFLFVGRFVPYKKADLVVEVFNKLGLDLRLIGTGSEENKLRRIAKNNIKFLGRASDEVLFENLKSAKAVIFNGYGSATAATKYLFLSKDGSEYTGFAGQHIISIVANQIQPFFAIVPIASQTVEYYIQSNWDSFNLNILGWIV